MKCRHCNADVSLEFADLGFAPPSNAYLEVSALDRPEVTYPLRVLVCEQCWLVQTKDFAQADELFSAEYAYFSSTSQGWLAHAQAFVEMATQRFELDENSHVIEIASNDGYLLKNFVEAGIPCLGIEPTDSTADAAEALGIPQCRAFFGKKLAASLKKQGKDADFVIGNNVLAHVPDINDFCAGVHDILKSDGVVSFEFPHLLNLIRHLQFDTIYHEHFSYLSLGTVSTILKAVGLDVFDVAKLPTHGGSLRLFAGHAERHKVQPSVAEVLAQETDFGLFEAEPYQEFQAKTVDIKNAFLGFLLNAKSNGQSVAAYGAAAKGNTLLNYAGVGTDLIQFVCDAAPAKQGKFMPGSHLPITHPNMLNKSAPDILLILPWNIASEVVKQNNGLRDQGTEFYVAIPEMKKI